jgi:hypothetical protein
MKMKKFVGAPENRWPIMPDKRKNRAIFALNTLKYTHRLAV